MGSQRVRHSWVTNNFTLLHLKWWAHICLIPKLTTRLHCPVLEECTNPRFRFPGAQGEPCCLSFMNQTSGCLKWWHPQPEVLSFLPLFPQEASRAQALMASPQASLPRCCPEHQPRRKFMFSSLGFQGTARVGPQLVLCLLFAKGPMPCEPCSGTPGPQLKPAGTRLLWKLKLL